MAAPPPPVALEVEAGAAADRRPAVVAVEREAAEAEAGAALRGTATEEGRIVHLVEGTEVTPGTGISKLTSEEEEVTAETDQDHLREASVNMTVRDCRL